MSVHVFGIRHHGPGSARSLLAALERLNPDLIMVEGPPDANGTLPLGLHPQMEPPVALLVYAVEQVHLAGYYPFAVFSPEWQAIRYGLKNNVVARFMDLPQAHQMALKLQAMEKARDAAQKAGEAANVGTPPEVAGEEPKEPPEPEIHEDPLYWLAKAAGFNDGERWWERMVEQRQDGEGIFAAILEAMTALREAAQPSPDPALPLREAYMRRLIRAAKSEGFRRIAVVCGAWHAPVLAKMPSVRADNALLKNLPRIEVKTAWVPWTHGRLARGSGYGAGINSPGWYHYLWTSPEAISVGWITRVARLLRDQDLDASPAQIIDAVRLADSLAALRDRPVPGLDELNEAILSVLCFGNAEPMRLIARQLIVGELMGRVPEEAPTVPLQQDLSREQERLDLKPDPVSHTLELDLREPSDLEISHLLHRLSLLGLPWGSLRGTGLNPGASRPGARSPFGSKPGQPQPGGSLLRRIQRNSGQPPMPPPDNSLEKSTPAHEKWQMQWLPEFAVKVIEASIWGNTVYEASVAFSCSVVDKTDDLATLTKLIERVLLADLPTVVDHLMARVAERSALTSDVSLLMDTLPPLARVLRYGTVRQTDLNQVRHIVDGLVARVCIGLPNACTFIASDAAAEMFKRIMVVDAAINMLDIETHLEAWHTVLRQIAEHDTIHPLLNGRACRLLFEAHVFDVEEVTRQTGLALSRANDPVLAAAWLEGFLKGNGMTLLYDESLWQILNNWLRALPGDTFNMLLPVLRRTFASFTAPERRQLGERAGRGTTSQTEQGESINVERADLLLPMLTQLLKVRAGT